MNKSPLNRFLASYEEENLLTFHFVDAPPPPNKRPQNMMSRFSEQIEKIDNDCMFDWPNVCWKSTWVMVIVQGVENDFLSDGFEFESRVTLATLFSPGVGLYQ